MSYVNSVKVIVSPWQKGFHCGIIMDSKSKMSTEQYELCSTIARGMIKMATTDPHSTFLWGLRGFAEDKKKNNKDLNRLLFSTPVRKMVRKSIGMSEASFNNHITMLRKKKMIVDKKINSSILEAIKEEGIEVTYKIGWTN